MEEVFTEGVREITFEVTGEKNYKGKTDKQSMKKRRNVAYLQKFIRDQWEIPADEPIVSTGLTSICSWEMHSFLIQVMPYTISTR